MDSRKIIYFLLLIIIIVIFLSSISVNVSYSSNGTNNSVSSHMNNSTGSNNSNLPDSLYIHDMGNINNSNTVYAKIVDRPDVSVHKQLLSSENKFYTNRCSL